MNDAAPLGGVAAGVYAVKVRVAGEKTVADTLRGKGFDVMMPVVETRLQYSDRIKRAKLPLFPGYVFVRLSGMELMPLVSTRGVSHLVKTGRDVEPLPPEDLTKIELLCNRAVDCAVCEYLTVGQRVRIESGPLAGITGVLNQAGGGPRVVLSVNSIFQSVSVDVRDTKLSVLDN
jgi:transcription antitermination factor NusG